MEGCIPGFSGILCDQGTLIPLIKEESPFHIS